MPHAVGLFFVLRQRVEIVVWQQHQPDLEGHERQDQQRDPENPFAPCDLEAQRAQELRDSTGRSLSLLHSSTVPALAAGDRTSDSWLATTVLLS